VINMTTEADIISLHNNGMSIKKISRECVVSRNTVRKYLRRYENILEQMTKETNESKLLDLQSKLVGKPVKAYSNKKKTALTDEVQKRIMGYLEIDANRDLLLGSNKQRLTSTKIYKELIQEGYIISESTVRTYVRSIRKLQKEVYIRREFDYGQRLEYDFHMVKLQVDGKVIRYHQVTITCPKSGYIWIKLYPNENKQTVIRSLVEFIDHCGGVFKEFVFDNMSTVVNSSSYGKEKKIYTDDIVKLSLYYRFRIVTCNVRAGWEKGSVENGGKNIRNELFSLDYIFNNELEVSEYVSREVEKFNNKRIDEFEKEKTVLIHKPAMKYQLCDYIIRKVNSYSCVYQDSNYYSVPDKYTGSCLSLQVYQNEIVIYDKNKIVARHIKKDGVKEYSIKIEHFENTFRKKPGALRDSLALKSNQDLHTIFNVDYSMDSKRFIEDLFNNNLRKNNVIDNTNTDDLDLITKLSKSQLDTYTTMFK